MKNRKKILILGYGVIGGMVLDDFCRSPFTHDLYIAGRNIDALTRRAHTSIFSAINLGYSPSVRFTFMDLMKETETAELLARISPDIIFNATSMLPWWRLDTLPQRFKEKVKRAGDGAWTPIDLVLPYKLMQIVRDSGIKTLVVNGSYADVTNPALHRIGLGPLSGIGNVANTIPGLKYAISDELGVPLSAIEIKFVAHHSVSHSIPSYGHTRGAPYHLTIYINGEIYEDASAERLFSLSATRYKRVRGVAGQSVTASSATQLLQALANDFTINTHAPGPNGYIGGYPVVVNGEGISIALPSTLSLTQAEQINIEAQRWDGIENIDDNGNITFTGESVEAMKEAFCFECRKLQIRDCEGWSLELFAKFQELVNSG